MAESWQYILRSILVNHHVIAYFVMVKVLRIAAASTLILGVIFLLRWLFRREKKGKEELCYPLWIILLTAPLFVRFQGFSVMREGADYFAGQMVDAGLISRAADSGFVALIYMAGVVLSVAASVRHSAKLKARIKRMQDIDGDGVWGEAWEETNRLFGTRRIRCAVSDCTFPPYSSGIRRPVVILPSDYRTRYQEDEFGMVLCHELLHIYSHDLVVLKMYEVFRCLMWFHPIVWLGARYIKQDMECYNDYRMLHVREADAGKYGAAIIKSLSCRAPHRLEHGQAAVSLIDEKQNLMVRFNYIADAKTVRRRSRIRFYIILSVFLAAGSVFVLDNSHKAFTNVNKVMGVAPKPLDYRQMSEQDIKDAHLFNEEECRKVAQITDGRVTIQGRELEQMLRDTGYGGEEVIVDLYLYNKEQFYTVTGCIALDRSELDKEVLKIPLAEGTGETVLNNVLKYL